MELISEKLTYRVDTEVEAVKVIEEFRSKQNAEGYTIGQNGYKMKQKKDRKSGEIIDEWAIVVVEKKYE